eukprot:1264504-Prymnesium_polylepis.1
MVLASDSSLTSIDISRNLGGPEFGKAIAAGIRDSRSLMQVCPIQIFAALDCCNHPLFPWPCTDECPRSTD